MLLTRIRPFVVIVSLLLSALGLAAQSTVHDQAPPTSSAPPQTNQDQQSQQEPEESGHTFKAQVNVVSIFFNVKDHHGLLVPGLMKGDFDVFEDGKPQPVKYFSADANQPLTLGILIDTSPSQERVLTIEQQSCVEFLHAVLRPKDLAFLINFDSDIDLDQDFTNNV